MTNADLFKQTFGIYAEEFWSFDEKQMLGWLNADVPDRNVGDLISRKVAIEALCTPHGFRYPIRTIEEQPFIQPERKRGKWVSDEDGNIYCSVCGRTGVGESFCEHCGANMKGEEE